MNAGTGKMGRRAGSAGKKTIPAPSINRPASAGRLSMGGGPRGRGAVSSAAISSPPAASLQVDESFGLVRKNPLNFGIAIKLTPDLVEEIKRVEAQGGTARIKFDANANNPNGNVIHSGDKSFRFTWSREPGDLCDIYEECRNGENGNGLLVESGGTWRKLNVERELDDSTKNHVKRMSEEAERKLKSRKAIVLDPQNPSMKNQMKAFAAVESHPRKAFNRKEPPFKKLKSQSSGSGAPLTFSKSSTPLSKSNFSGSPLSSQPAQHGPSASPTGSGHVLKGHAGTTEALHTKSTKRISSDRETPGRLVSSTARENTKQSCNADGKSSDLRSLMVSLLLEHQDKGMSLKDLERAVGDAAPNSAREMESTLKLISSYNASGKYFLKADVEMEFMNKQRSQNQSSPETNHHQAPELPKFNTVSPQDTMVEATNDEVAYALSDFAVLTADDVEKIDIRNTSPEHSDEKKTSNNGRGNAGSSSDSRSGSDSDSDSSESDSDSGSRSRSKSRSPRQSCSGSSSDTKSDASPSSKQASDEDVDIMSGDDDKDSHHALQVPASLKSPIHNRDYEKHGGALAVFDKDLSREVRNAERQATDIRREEDEEPLDKGQMWRQNGHTAPDFEAYDAHRESKREFDDAISEERKRNRKRFKSTNSSHPVPETLISIFGDTLSNSSPDTPTESPDKAAQNGVRDLSGLPGLDQIIPSSHTVDAQGVQRSSEACELSKNPSGGRRPSKKDALGRAVKYPEKNIQSATDRGNGPHSSSYTAHSPKNINTSHASRSPVADGRRSRLTRELSDLEAGELRETAHDEISVDGSIQFERKSPLKQLDKRSVDLGCQNSDTKRVKVSDKVTADLGKPSPQIQEPVVSTAANAASKRKTSDKSSGGTRPHLQEQKIGSHNAKVGESKSKARYEAGPSTAATTSKGEASRKASKHSTDQLHDPISGSRSSKGRKKHRAGSEGQTNGRLKGATITVSNKGEIKESSDEFASLFLKYEKKEPELRGPIKDISQYQSCVKEFQEKYETYSSLSKALESYSNEFSKLGKELDACKGRNSKRYHDIVGQIMSSYRQCGQKHKRMKKIFLLLYEELKHLKQMIKDFAASSKTN